MYLLSVFRWRQGNVYRDNISTFLYFCKAVIFGDSVKIISEYDERLYYKQHEWLSPVSIKLFLRRVVFYWGIIWEKKRKPDWKDGMKLGVNIKFNQLISFSSNFCKLFFLLPVDKN